MAFVLQDGQGSLSANTRKTTDQHPDIKGKFKLNGVMHSIAGWKKISKNDGSIWYSLAVQALDESAQCDRRTGEGQSDDPAF